ncbi:MAG: hypothetical protein SGJ02_01290 [bacterium]|nr:hypothetical protein [bacterium]
MQSEPFLNSDLAPNERLTIINEALSYNEIVGFQSTLAVVGIPLNILISRDPSEKAEYSIVTVTSNFSQKFYLNSEGQYTSTLPSRPITLGHHPDDILSSLKNARRLNDQELKDPILTEFIHQTEDLYSDSMRRIAQDLFLPMLEKHHEASGENLDRIITMLDGWEFQVPYKSSEPSKIVKTYDNIDLSFRIFYFDKSEFSELIFQASKSTVEDRFILFSLRNIDIYFIKDNNEPCKVEEVDSILFISPIRVGEKIRIEARRKV